MMHEADSPGHVLLLKVCENYHAILGECQRRSITSARYATADDQSP